MAFHMREATEDDIPALCDVFFDAFSEDPISGIIFPRTSEHAQAEMLDTFKHSVAEPGVHVFVVTEEQQPPPSSAADKKDAVVAYVEWVSPRAEPYSPPAPAPGKTVSEETEALAREFFEVMERKQREHMGRQPHWHLAFIAVRKRVQGKGLARPLIQWGVDKADEAGMEAYVQASPMAAPRYRRYGFEDIESHHFALAGDYHEVFLKRKPQPQKQKQRQASRDPKATSDVAARECPETRQTTLLFNAHGSSTIEGNSLERFEHPASAIVQVG